jgi:hypothetical protein
VVWTGAVFGSHRWTRNDEQIRQGLLLSRDLYVAGLNDEWATIYEPTAFYVGLSDDLAPANGKLQPTKFSACARRFPSTRTRRVLKFSSPQPRTCDQARIAPRFGLQQGIPKDTPNMIQGPLPSGSQLRFMGSATFPTARSCSAW